MRRMRFTLKTLLVVITLIAIYLAWRIRDPEARVLTAIQAAGGESYYGYQHPWMGSTVFFSVAMLPSYEYFSQHDIACTGTQTPPSFTVTEIIFGPTNERRINAVVLPLGQVTPELEELLMSLAELRYVVIEMPAMMTSSESPEAKRLRELKRKFGGKLWPTVKLGMHRGG